MAAVGAQRHPTKVQDKVAPLPLAIALSPRGEDTRSRAIAAIKGEIFSGGGRMVGCRRSLGPCPVAFGVPVGKTAGARAVTSDALPLNKVESRPNALPLGCHVVAKKQCVGRLA